MSAPVSAPSPTRLVFSSSITLAAVSSDPAEMSSTSSLTWRMRTVTRVSAARAPA